MNVEFVKVVDSALAKYFNPDGVTDPLSIVRFRTMVNEVAEAFILASMAKDEAIFDYLLDENGLKSYIEEFDNDGVQETENNETATLDGAA